MQWTQWAFHPMVSHLAAHALCSLLVSVTFPPLGLSFNAHNTILYSITLINLS